ncbi:2-amino-4-hydroxy-6-hydroxymethyldihydropteridine diphosphokinase [Mangrovibacterium lignilyticum]|uniref:2-amino-4-hydroxy-6- hydroxymethyldihydropteridine diphosphokinase n=1 Tax=Mangrovibacterium lignilyticum TaxID=2668052 RepID=UPI0013D8DF23|nr:2-amino-4-hydroxy-6-hydroxymethyldihydropteridine diphosphokinase [Mangrovibacterium lignilyticum]
MAKLFLLLGGNLGNKEQIFSQARKRLQEELGAISQLSSVYETEPWGFESEDLFWNQVVVIETALMPKEVLVHTKAIELELGRIRKAARYSSRLIDIDLLFYDDLVLHEPNLELPHPRMIDRRFVLEPLAEVAADFLHPVFKQNIVSLLEDCGDQLQVKRLID